MFLRLKVVVVVAIAGTERKGDAVYAKCLYLQINEDFPQQRKLSQKFDSPCSAHFLLLTAEKYIKIQFYYFALFAQVARIFFVFFFLFLRIFA